MPLRLVALDPETPGDDCPAMFIDTDSGELVFQGVTETDPDTLAEINAVSRLRPGESAVRLPRRMHGVILEALLEADGDRGEREADPAR